MIQQLATTFLQDQRWLREVKRKNMIRPPLEEPTTPRCPAIIHNNDIPREPKSESNEQVKQTNQEKKSKKQN